jgi:hypothetical protein
VSHVLAPLAREKSFSATCRVSAANVYASHAPSGDQARSSLRPCALVSTAVSAPVSTSPIQTSLR